jgi:hypothetical protein
MPTGTDTERVALAYKLLVVNLLKSCGDLSKCLPALDEDRPEHQCYERNQQRVFDKIQPGATPEKAFRKDHYKSVIQSSGKRK